MTGEKKTEYIIIPPERLSEEALRGLIEEFILREGTDYGQKEYTLAEKQGQILKQLVAEKVVVVFDPAEETASIVHREQLK